MNNLSIFDWTNYTYLDYIKIMNGVYIEMTHFNKKNVIFHIELLFESNRVKYLKFEFDSTHK